MRTSIYKFVKEEIEGSVAITETPVDAGELYIPEENVDNTLLDLNNATNDSEALDVGVVDGNGAAAAIDDISEAVATTTDTTGMTPLEIKTVDIAVEYFKRRIGYIGVKAMPALEMFGGKTSKVQATKLAVESLSELAEEISVETDKATLMRFQYEINTLTCVAATKTALVTATNKAKATANDVFNGTNYTALSGGKVEGFEFIKHVFSKDQSMDGNMPAVAVVSDLAKYKSTFSTSAFKQKLTEVTGLVEKLSSEECKTAVGLDSVYTSIRGIFSNVLESRTYENDHGSRSFKVVTLPLGGGKLEIGYPSDKSVAIGDYYYGSTSVYNDFSNIGTLSTLSKEETETILTTVSDLVTTNNDAIADLIKKTTEASKAMKVNEAALLAAGNTDSDKYSKLVWCATDAVIAFISFLVKIASKEVVLMNALVQYAQASMSVSTKPYEVAPAATVVPATETPAGTV